MIREAEKSLGLGESPAGSNKNYITKWYGLVGPWCNMAITYWSNKSGNQGSVCFGGKFAYTVAHANAFKARGQWHTDIAGIRRGDIVFFDWSGSNSIGAIDHVGIVTGTGRDSEGYPCVFTIEGNIGNVCARKVRYSNWIAGYGRPKYSGATPADPPPPSAPPSTTKYVPYPGEAWFKAEPNSPIVTAMGKRLVAVGCSAYEDGPGPQWTEADRASYRKWQVKCGFTGTDANGWPGKTSWDKLKVPK